MEKKNFSLATRGGSYSLAITAVVLAILIVLNLFASALPVNLTKLDISSSQLYSITSNTKVVVNNLQEDVTIYWIVQADKEDSILTNLLAKYESLSDHIKVVKKNPDVFPTFAQQYTDEQVLNNSLVVECGDRFRYIPYNDIFLTEADVYTYSYTTSFDGEGAITSAIDYVTREDLPQLYVLEGHGEAELPATFADQLEKENIEVNTFSLLNVDEIPEEAAAVLIHAPSSDISEEEADMLTEYAENGGKLMVFAGPTEDVALPNLYSVLEQYGITAEQGIVVEAERNSYAFQMPYVLLPTMESSPITDALSGQNYFAIMPIAQGLTIGENTKGAVVTPLLTTSQFSFSKTAGFALETYEKEEGDVDGPFTVALTVDTAAGGSIAWFASSNFLNDMYNAYSSGANVDLAMNAVSSLVGETEAMAIRSKSLNYNYLTISESTGTFLKVLMIGIVPLAYLGIGIAVMVNTRRKQNEQV